jgi:hypothetical protein
MSEQTRPETPELETLLPIDALFLFCAVNSSQFTCDTVNKTITMSETYTYDENTIRSWKALIQNQLELYQSQLSEASEMDANDYEYFTSCLDFVSRAMVQLNIEE